MRVKRTAAERFRILRKRRGMTERDVAQLTGLSLSTICEIEGGLVRNPGVRTVMSVAEIVGVTLDVSFGYDDNHGELLREMPVSAGLRPRCRDCGTLQLDGRHHRRAECVLACSEAGRMSHEEIAEHLGYTPASVAVIISEEIRLRRRRPSAAIFTDAPWRAVGSARA